MRLSDLEINQESFFKVGRICFLIIGIANIFSYFLNLSNQNFFSTIAAWASIIFNFALAGFFQYLLNQAKQSEPQITEEYQSDDISEIIEQIKKKNKKVVNREVNKEVNR